MKRKGIFIGATGQNVGKTTVCLGLIALLQKKFNSIGFIKPVGQRHATTETGITVDKDVILFKKHFNLKADYQSMSPVIFPRGFTRDYLDGKFENINFEEQIKSSYDQISKDNDFTIVEGTGHIGVGSITDLNNAKVAKLLGLDVIVISSGGIGSAFDELALNITMLQHYGVKIKGVILNRVMQDKKAMIKKYISLALKRWDIPLLGCVPFDHFLSTSSMNDFETLFQTDLISGFQYRYHHFENILFVATSQKVSKEDIPNNQLIITSSSRSDVISALIDKHKKAKENPFEVGLILTGKTLPKSSLIQKLKKTSIPVIYTNCEHYEAMQMICQHTSKILNEDIDKVYRAIHLVEQHINLNLLCD